MIDPYSKKIKTVEISIETFLSDLMGTPLFAELNTYLTARPALLFLFQKKLDSDILNKFINQLEIDQGNNLLSTTLLDSIRGRIAKRIEEQKTSRKRFDSTPINPISSTPKAPR